MESEKKKSRYTPAQKSAIDNYRAKRSKIELNISNEQKEQIKEAAANENKSMNQFILNCILEHLKKQ